MPKMLDENLEKKKLESIKKTIKKDSKKIVEKENKTIDLKKKKENSEPSKPVLEKKLQSLLKPKN